MAEPCDLTAVEARRLIGARALSPVELVESCIRRIKHWNPHVNAVVTWPPTLCTLMPGTISRAPSTKTSRPS